MKKYALFTVTAVITAVSFIFTSCGVKSGDILWYQRYPLVAEVTTEDASLIITVCGDEKVKAEIVSPSELAGVSFVFGENDAIVVKDTEIPINRSSAEKVLSLAAAFLLDKDSVVSVDTDGDVSVVTFRKDSASYVFTYDTDGVPVGFVCKTVGKEIKADITKITPAPEESSDEPD